MIIKRSVLLLLQVAVLVACSTCLSSCSFLGGVINSILSIPGAVLNALF